MVAREWAYVEGCELVEVLVAWTAVVVVEARELEDDELPRTGDSSRSPVANPQHDVDLPNGAIPQSVFGHQPGADLQYVVHRHGELLKNCGGKARRKE